FEPHHPGTSRHPSSTRRGKHLTMPSSSRRAGRDKVADGWSCGASNPTTPSLRTPPPRHFVPPLLAEEGTASDYALLVEEGRTRQGRGRVVMRRFKPHHPVASNPTTPALRATPPRRGGESI